ncbi:MAG: amidohydrolase family protein [Phycisphaerae bacterium]
MTITIDGCCQLELGLNSQHDVLKLLERMDRLGIARCVAFPPDECFAWENESGNEAMITLMREHPDRIIPAVTVNPWRPNARQVLLRGLERGGLPAFSPGVQGLMLSDRKLDTLLQLLMDEKIHRPVYLHTGHHSHGAPSQLALLAGRFPQLNFIMGHSGATDYSTDVVPVCRMCPNIYIESSFARPPGFVVKLNQIGFDRGIFGSGYPFNSVEFEWSEMKRLLPVEHQTAVLGGNLTRLLKEHSA